MLFAVMLCVICIQRVNSESITLRNQTRRILRGSTVGDTRPYMVYLRPAAAGSDKPMTPNWLCGGVIIRPQYVLTSAACIEDVKQFYVISGTHRWLPLGEEDECVKNGAKKAIWKCVSKDYVFDGKEFDNIRWMISDIAVVKVDEAFNMERRIRGCDFVPKMIAYNNQSESLEAAGTVASIAGWGSVDRFGDNFGRTTMNSPDLLETDVVLISKKKCKRQWAERYHYIIEKNMVCAKDSDDSDVAVICKNDHGGPLVVGHGMSAVVIGVISACMTANVTQKCYGPFLYTSVWRNRHLIDCAIQRDTGASCLRMLRSLRMRLVETKYDWPSLRKGPETSIDTFDKYQPVEKYTNIKEE